MKRAGCLLLWVVVVTMFAACGDPNPSDTPGAGLATTNAAASQPSPTPTPLATAATITTPCTKGQTKTTIDGLRIRDTKCGTGPEATRGSTIKVKYVGKLATGQVFDSSKRHGNKPFKTPIGMNAVIPGWDEGVPGMRVGGVRMLTIPPALGYGASGAGTIPPNSTLEFKIRLVGVVPSPSPS